MSDKKIQGLELIEELMGCEHMGDVTRLTWRLAAAEGVELSGCHGDWESADWNALDRAKEAEAQP